MVFWIFYSPAPKFFFCTFNFSHLSSRTLQPGQTSAARLRLLRTLALCAALQHQFAPTDRLHFIHHQHQQHQLRTRSTAQSARTQQIPTFGRGCDRTPARLCRLTTALHWFSRRSRAAERAATTTTTASATARPVAGPQPGPELLFALDALRHCTGKSS